MTNLLLYYLTDYNGPSAPLNARTILIEVELGGIIEKFRLGEVPTSVHTYSTSHFFSLRNRAGDAATCDWIWGEHPEWKEPSRRLTSCVDRKNVRSWKGDTKVANVNEVACWNDGRDQALALLNSVELFSADELDIDLIIETEAGVDMFRPYCRTIGVLAGDRAEYTLADLDEVGDDEEVEA